MKRKNPEKKFRIEKILSEHAEVGPHSFAVILDGLKPGFNIGKIFRSAQAFGAREICLVGIEFFDPYPAKGAFKQTHSRSFKSFEDCHAALALEGYSFWALDPEGEEILDRTEIPEKTAFVLGHEEFGLSFDPAKYPSLKRVRIRQWGWVESLNVSVAASLAMYEHCRKWARSDSPPKRFLKIDSETP
ncbi:MAG: TrmH family RNA methyltransferase [Bdellovibrionota bacterium]